MAKGNGQSTRLLIDLQACQTEGSAHRGVGRYSRALFDAIVDRANGIDLYALVASGLPHVPRDLAIGRSRLWQMPPLPDWGTARSYEGGERDTLDALAYSSFVQRLAPDVVHVSHVFEGLGDRVPLPDLTRRSPGQVFSATLYDLIPLLFREHYFAIPQLEPWYHARAAWLRRADLLLAISESTRQDAIRLLGIDPSRVVTIHGGISDHFGPAKDPGTARRALRKRYALRDRFVLYTGGDDHRKNLQGAIDGFAALPEPTRRDLQLVIVCSMSEERKRWFLAHARAKGLPEEQLLITGFVPEHDLVALYGTCALFVFPSLYEGLGLPVLEAMACGAPVIGGDNSSVREIIERPDALFDAERPESIASRIAAVLGDPALAGRLREHGLARAREFTWDHAAQRALAAFDEARERARASGARAVTEGWVPRKRLAVLSPLPPAHSGIADYNAEFLPHLARHFDIDLHVDEPVRDNVLKAMFRVFDVRDFDRVAASYDAILYEFGNSSFHLHMLDLLRRFPGVVGLHDAYLSGLYRYAAMACGTPAAYPAAMLGAHGPRARRYFAPVAAHGDADESAMVDLPCTKEVLDGAIGVISHTPYNLGIASDNYPESWRAPYWTIAQMVSRKPRLSDAQREAIRKRLGYGAGDFVVATFGHVAWTKWGDRLLRAFLASSLRDDPRAYLLFAGELTRDEFGARLKQAIARSGLGKRVQVAGYLPEPEYEAALCAADLGVQLRTKSRGGTPKGVLDCMARAVPVVVNNDASYVDYPDDVVIKLPSDPTIEEIASLLTRAAHDPQWLQATVSAASAYVASQHDPGACAAAYAAAIHEFTERHRFVTGSAWPDAFGPGVAACPDPARAATAAAAWLDSLPRPEFRRRRVYVDVSHIAQSDHRTGVPRVVKQIVRSMACTERAGLEPVAVELRDGGLVVARQWLSSQGLLVAHEQGEEHGVAFAAGDVLLMLDSSWARYGEFRPVFEQVRAAGATIVTAVYDLLPILLAPGNIGEGGKEWFEVWFRDAVAQSDGLVCISRTVAEQARAYIMHNDLGRPDLAVGYWHLGSNFALAGASTEPTARVAAAGAAPYLLMVGTIEPRKHHALALDAMELLWNRGEQLRLVIAGKEGWMVADLVNRLRQHDRLASRLFLLEEPTDAEIAALYERAAGLLFLSKGEGFGLPLVEAANHGVPIVCSDLPVFREVAGEFATYVTGATPGELSSELASWWERRRANAVPDTGKMPRLTWEQSAEALLKVVVDGQWSWKAG